MLVYGDQERRERPAARLAALELGLADVEVMLPGLARHSALVALLLEAGELAQGLLDAEFAGPRRDDATPLARACMELLWALAGSVVTSWESDFQRLRPIPPGPLAALRRLPLPAEVSVKVPEGYAFYALYPEAYAEAARALASQVGPLRAVGLRSIGTSLAAIVAAASRGGPPATVRPVGHPFQRTLSLSPALAEQLLADGAELPFAVVDEGPGLSGSSFGAVADFLEDRGVAPERIHFFPSHAGDLGPRASERHRARWARAPRHVVDFEALFVRTGGPRSLAGWVEELTGPAEGPCEDVGGGGWRRRLFAHEREWPAVHVQQERRKYLLPADGRTWLLKFAGLGRVGERRVALARALEREGFIPGVAGLRHGFLVMPWLSRARPLALASADRPALVARVGDYLGFRARHLRADASRGASAPRLLEMARHNAAQALGAELAGALEAWAPRLGALEAAGRRVETDNKLQPWEWLVLPDGELLKADALDHHAAHDLVGCQDIAWDLAGAAVELQLSADEQALLLELVARRAGAAPGPEALAFHTLCYLAFQLGQHTLASEALAGLVPAEAARLGEAARRYREALRQRLTAG